MSIVLQGSTSGSITLQEPAVAGSTVLSLPATSGTLITTGSTGQVIPKAALPTGSVLQVVQASITGDFSTSSSTYVHATNHSLSITTEAANSKILLMCNTPIQVDTGDRAQTTFRYSVDSYANNFGQTVIINEAAVDGGWMQTTPLHYLHSPNQAAGTAMTYRVYIRRASGNSTVYYPDAWGYTDEYSFIAMKIAA